MQERLLGSRIDLSAAVYSGPLAAANVDAPSRRHSWLGFYPALAVKERTMPKAKKPLQPNDFPVNAEDKKIKKQDGTPIADTDDPAVADDVAERLNEDEARREEDKWSA